MSMNSEKNAPLIAFRRFSSMDCSVAALAAPCVVTASMLVSIDVVLHRSRMLLKCRTSALGGVGFVGLDRIGRDPEGRERKGSAAVHGGLHQHGANLFLRDAVLERAFHVHGQLVMLAHGSQHADVEHAPGLECQGRIAPDLAPCVFSDELLHRPVEVVRIRPGLLDMQRAEYFLAVLEALVKT